MRIFATLLACVLAVGSAFGQGLTRNSVTTNAHPALPASIGAGQALVWDAVNLGWTNGTTSATATNAISSINGGTSNLQAIVIWTATETSNTFGIQTAQGAGGGTNYFHFPTTDATHSGVLSSNDWIQFSNIAATNFDTTQFTVSSKRVAIKGFAITTNPIVYAVKGNGSLFQVPRWTNSSATMDRISLVTSNDMPILTIRTTNDSIEVNHPILYIGGGNTVDDVDKRFEGIHMEFPNILDLNSDPARTGFAMNFHDVYAYELLQYRFAIIDGGVSAHYNWISNTATFTISSFGDTNLISDIYGRAIRLKSPLLPAASELVMVKADGTLTNVTLGGNLTLVGTTLDSVAAGTGDFVGPAGATDNAVVRFDSTTGKLGQNSLVVINDVGSLFAPGSVTNGADLRVQGQITVTASNSATAGLIASSFSNGNSQVIMQVARDPEASPSKVLAGDQLGNLEWLGYGAANYRSAFRIRPKVLTDFTGSSAETLAMFSVGNNSATIREVIGLSAYNETNNINVFFKSNATFEGSVFLPGLATNSFLYLKEGTNIAAGTFGSGLSFSSGTLTATGGAGTPGGATPMFQVNNAGVFVGSSNAVYDVTNGVAYLSNLVVSGFVLQTNVQTPTLLGTNLTVDGTKGNYWVVGVRAQGGSGLTNLLFTNVLSSQEIIVDMWVTNGVTVQPVVPNAIDPAAIPGSWYTDGGVVTINTNGYSRIRVRRNSLGTNVIVSTPGLVLVAGTGVTFTTNFAATPQSVTIASTASGGGLTQFQTNNTLVANGTNINFFAIAPLFMFATNNAVAASNKVDIQLQVNTTGTGNNFMMQGSPSASNTLSILGTVGTQSGFLRIFGTNTGSFTGWSMPPEWLPTNVFQWCFTNVAVGDVLRVQRVSVSGGQYDIYVTNASSASLAATFQASSMVLSNLVGTVANNLTNANTSQFASGNTATLKDGVLTTNLTSQIKLLINGDAFVSTNLNANSARITNQLYYEAQNFNGSNGVTATALTNMWDMSTNVFKPVTNFVGTNLAFTLSNVTASAAIISEFIGLPGFTNTIWIQAQSGVNIKWKNWDTNANNGGITIRDNRSYTLQAFADRATNVSVWVSTDDPYVPMAAYNFTAVNAGISNLVATNLVVDAGGSSSNATVGGTLYKQYYSSAFTNGSTTPTFYSNAAFVIVKGHTLTNVYDGHVTLWRGRMLAGTNSIRMIYGLETVLDTGAIINTNTTWEAGMEITRTGNSTAHADAWVNFILNTGTAFLAITNCELTANNGIDNTNLLQIAGNKAGSISNNFLKVTWVPAAK